LIQNKLGASKGFKGGISKKKTNILWFEPYPCTVSFIARDSEVETNFFQVQHIKTCTNTLKNTVNYGTKKVAAKTERLLSA